MATVEELDRAFAAVMGRIVETGQAPHYSDLAGDLDLTMDEGRELLVELVDSGIPAWLHPGTDYLGSFPPFNVQPTQYRVRVEGPEHAHKAWFAQ
ncbi:MAG: hypothetical protein OEY23_13895 [Acidimicrobiia bacterium]|nr:hypothetical protein [Acidimicrobiia bacterium]